MHKTDVALGHQGPLKQLIYVDFDTANNNRRQDGKEEFESEASPKYK